MPPPSATFTKRGHCAVTKIRLIRWRVSAAHAAVSSVTPSVSKITDSAYFLWKETLCVSSKEPLLETHPGFCLLFVSCLQDWIKPPLFATERSAAQSTSYLILHLHQASPRHQGKNLWDQTYEKEQTIQIKAPPSVIVSWFWKEMEFAPKHKAVSAVLSGHSLKAAWDQQG